MRQINSGNSVIATVLSKTVLIDNSKFTPLNVAAKTAVLVEIGSLGLPIQFVENYVELRKVNKLAEKLLNGEDVSIELEFNEVEFSKEEIDALVGVKPLFERIRALKPKYKFAEIKYDMGNKLSIHRSKASGNPTSIRTQTGYTMTVLQFKKAWQSAREFWNDESSERIFNNHDIAGYSRSLTVYDDHVTYGCQTVSRSEIERIAVELELV